MLNNAELTEILKQLSVTAAGIPECGFVIPAPLYFTSDSDIRAKLEPMTTQKDIETQPIAVTTLSVVRPPDRPTADGDAWIYYFSFHVFRRATETRVNEADSFLRQLLEQYSLFSTGWLGLVESFKDETPLPNISDRILECYAEYEDGADFIEENGNGKYVLSEIGHSVDLPIKVTVVFKEC